MDSQGERGECINKRSRDLLVGSTLILKAEDPGGSSIQIQNDQKVLELKAERLLSVRLLNTQSWEDTEYEAVDADRHAVPEAGEHILA